ncbi:leucine-rich alpha-2-glycoprotein [Austrofundulus limnaeus]|uniref:Leucine-rich alpha-2-glycoprotein n=1 Tax=Austrofundulus limnaeus TaxID=52670 RepID=A0A2I4BTQ6_AUSLI|nr:PREDICTED: leucine-rich alpha-2-glycoprotein-like [Austrofundulus limnaeus]
MKLLLLLTFTALAEFDYRRRSALSCPTLCFCRVTPAGAEVVCSRRGLSGFPAAALPPNTTVLSVQNANISSLTAAQLRAVPLLSELQIYRSNLVNLSSELLVGVPHLNTLDLTGNQLLHLPPKVFSRSSLQSLIVKNNRLESADAAWFSDNSSLTWLDLSGNRLTSIPAALLQKLPRLVALDLDDNDLRELPGDTFKGLRRLETLSLAGNKLTSLKPQTFAHNLQLKHLYLQENRLRNLSAGLLHGLRHLELVLLDRNHLLDLPAGLLHGINPSLQIALSGNPWECDGRMEHLRKWLRSHPENVLFLEEVTCNGPEALKHQQVASLTDELETCGKI